MKSLFLHSIFLSMIYSLIKFNTDDYIHMNDAGIPVKKNQNILYNLLVKSINEIKKHFVSQMTISQRFSHTNF